MIRTFPRTLPSRLSPALALLACACPVFLAARVGGAEGKPKGPPVQRLVWQAPHRIHWELALTPQWFSMGHANRVVCFVPRGVKEEGGVSAATRDGSGFVHAVDIEVHEVTAFDPKTSVPLTTKLLERKTVPADDPEALKRKRWEFPHEMPKFDWELSSLPVKEHQTLFRLFLHEGSLFRHTLMVHTEADLAPMPPALSERAGSKKCFTALACHVVVCELLDDPAVPLTSKYIEPDDPPSTWWIEKEQVKAPWALNQAKLAPAHGSLLFGGDGAMALSRLSDRAVDAARQLAERAKARPEVKGPSLPTEGKARPDKEGDQDNEAPELDRKDK